MITDGLRFPEGPSYLADGAVMVAEMKGEAITRVDADGTLTVLGDCGGGPNGSAAGTNGDYYVANNGGLSAEGMGYWHAPRQFDGVVQRVSADGTVATVGGALPGPAPHRPNDLCFGPDGTLYVTDSANWEDLRNLNPGHIVALAPDGSQRQSVEVPAMPNGIAVSPDGRLFITQSMTRKVLAFDLADGEIVGEPEVFAKLPNGVPDGFCFAEDGTAYVCGSVAHAVFVYGPDGELRETISTGDGTQPTNCCIGDDGSLYLTLALTGQLVAHDLGVKPAAVYRGVIG
ncbi:MULTISPECIES: SMP-30/gluconolactonase/LRE family protein [unclassified Nocardioides]|uniref:SMP-30/gluconolactonase/LRE family protein n=1 Tax=unclassified Nocardioides TaxID=2615069 RepID=UPI003613D7D0